MIRCIGDEIKAGDVEVLDELLTRNQQGWLITDTRIAQRAKERAAQVKGEKYEGTLGEYLIECGAIGEKKIKNNK